MSRQQSPFCLLPYLEVDGQKLPGAFPIDRYLARKFGLVGVDEWEQTTVDAIADWVKDIGIEVYPYMATTFGFKEGDVDKLRNEIFNPAMRTLTSKLEELLTASGSGFLVQSGYTWVDFLAAEALNAYEGAAPRLLDKHPKLKAYKGRVYSIPKIKDYTENRKSDLWHKYRHT
ncbi:GST-9 protein [Aphelenchoides avenae]|nr:GST-9 protein [Aphelenchus avenae]